ncbi:MAG: aminoacyl-tRNA hydrolase [Candidatus Aenigmatarchaeota archaeon]
MSKYKQVIVIRTDLKMGKGKLAAQVAHASLESYKRTDSRTREKWEDEGSKKVVVKVGSLKELKEVHEKAKKIGVISAVIRDAGRTQVARGTITCLGIGPDKEENVDKITSNLKLLG